MNEPIDRVRRLAAFCDGDRGGNPAGVIIADALPSDDDMRRIAAAVGYSETAFAMPAQDGWRVRYFSPEAEVPFCGHATIALGAALAMHAGADGLFTLQLNDATITVEGRSRDGRLHATLVSPPTRSTPATDDERRRVLDLFGLSESDLDLRIPPARIHAGADHVVLMLRDRATLAAMRYDLASGRALMRAMGWITVVLGHVDTPRRFAVRNPFAFGGVYEDPATGAAAAALAGYLRDLGWPHGGALELHQGDDMGVPCRLHAAIGDAFGDTSGNTSGDGIRVSGSVRLL